MQARRGLLLGEGVLRSRVSAKLFGVNPQIKVFAQRLPCGPDHALAILAVKQVQAQVL